MLQTSVVAASQSGFARCRAGLQVDLVQVCYLIALIFISVITNLVVYFVPTSLLQTVLMLGLVFGGLGLVSRALRPH